MVFFGFFSLLMVMFYTCNLRSLLVMKEYEKGIVGLEDILERGQTPYIPIAYPLR